MSGHLPHYTKKEKSGSEEQRKKFITHSGTLWEKEK
jgi:hypothetical protein